MMRSSTAPRFKGVVLRQLAPWVTRRFSPGDIQRSLASLPDGIGVGLDASRPDFGALASTWYDARIYQVMLDALLARAEDILDGPD